MIPRIIALKRDNTNHQAGKIIQACGTLRNFMHFRKIL
jgi:hypothetical protein